MDYQFPKGFLHVVTLGVSDIQKSYDFYTQILGMQNDKGITQYGEIEMAEFRHNGEATFLIMGEKFLRKDSTAW